PPMEEKSVYAAWRPGGRDLAGGLGGGAYPTGPACVVALTSHMHKRGVLFTIDFLNGRTAVPCPQNPQENGTCLTARDYTDPPQIQFDPPLLVNLHQGLRYTCTHDNGVNGRPIKMGCEEQPPVPCGATCDTSTGKCNLPPDAIGRIPSCATDQDCADAQCQ